MDQNCFTYLLPEAGPKAHKQEYSPIVRICHCGMKHSETEKQDSENENWPQGALHPILQLSLLLLKPMHNQNSYFFIQHNQT